MSQSTAMLFELLASLPKEAVAFVLAMIPITELRGAIPLAIFTMGLSPWDAFLWSVLGNSVAGVIVVILLEPVSTILRRLSLFDRFFSSLFERTRRRHSQSFKKAQELALCIFVAIPLPMTGAWSGAAAAFVFGMRKRSAIPSIVLGVVGAGVIVTLVSSGVLQLGGFLNDLFAPSRA